MTTSSAKIHRGRMANGQPNPIDKHVGNRIKSRRQLLGLSQENLAGMLGLTFQQIQKYEHGKNRVSASRLWDISRVLDVDIGFFFKDMEEETVKNSPKALLTGYCETKSLEETDPMLRQETFDLVRAYYKISNRSIARQLFELALIMAKSSFPENDESAKEKSRSNPSARHQDKNHK